MLNVLKEEIKKGTGKAYYIVKNNNNEDVEDLIYNAAINNLAYDAQCEGSRADYIYTIINAYKNSDKLKIRILSYFKRMRKNDWGAYQTFDLIKLFIQNDNFNADIIYNKIQAYINWYENDEIPGIFNLIELGGINAIIFLADKLGEIALKNNDYYINDYILTFSDEVTKKKCFPILKKEAKRNNNINAFVNRLFEQNKSIEKNKKPFKITYEEIIDRLNKDQRIISAFGRRLPQKDLLRIAQLLDKSADDKTKEKLLPLFSHKKYPLGVKHLIPYLELKNANIINNTLDCLSQFKSKQIRQIGLSFINKPKHTGHALNIFINNFSEEDCDLLQMILGKTFDDHEFHSRAMIVTDIFEKRRSKYCSKILYYIYNRLTCGICRYYVIKRMVSNNVVKPDIIKEAKYDSYEETRKLFYKQKERPRDKKKE